MRTDQPKSAMASILVLSVLLASRFQGSSAYVVAPPGTKPTTTSLNFPYDRISPYIDNSVYVNVEAIQSKRKKRNPLDAKPSKPARNTSYDLGLGKNQPVVSKKTTNVDSVESNKADVSSTVMYWSKHESVRNFPSPLEEREVKYDLPTAPTKKTRTVMPINPIRHVADSLPIIPNTRSEQSAAVRGQPLMMRSDSSQMDVNTAWVEMLIHSEQRKFATATAN